MIDWFTSLPGWVVKAGAIGAVAGPIIVFIFKDIWGHIFAPKVQIRIEIDDKPDCLPESNRDWGNGEGAIPRKFVRLRLYNDSRGMAKSCQVRLLHVYKICPREEIMLDYPIPKPLWWAGGGKPPYEPKAFAQGGPHFVDMLYNRFKDGKHQIILRDTDHSPVALELGNTYRFVVQGTADEAMTVTKQVDIRFGQSYKDIKIVRARNK